LKAKIYHLTNVGVELKGEVQVISLFRKGGVGQNNNAGILQYWILNKEKLLYILDLFVFLLFG